MRNTKVVDIYNSLKSYNLNLTVFDPWANKAIAKKEYGVEIMNEQPNQTYDAVILAVAHDQFKTVAVSELLEAQAVLYDVKGFFAKEQVDGRL